MYTIKVTVTNSENQASFCYQQLITSLQQSQTQPGDYLREQTLAQLFGVSSRAVESMQRTMLLLGPSTLIDPKRAETAIKEHRLLITVFTHDNRCALRVLLTVHPIIVILYKPISNKPLIKQFLCVALGQKPSC